jgi:predicted Zn-dependent peptidase
MSSRLFQTIREELGLAYSIGSFSEHFDDCGQFGTELSVSRENGRRAVERTLAEMRRLLDDGLDDGELESARAQVRGALIMGQESLTNRMLSLAATEHRLRRRETVEEKLAPYLAATEDDLRRVAGDLLDPSRQTLVALGPCRERDFEALGFRRVSVVKEPA